MARRPAPTPETDAEGFIMTPMIDVTFQLLIFFMLILDFSEANTEQLLLPPATQSVAEQEFDPLTVVVNVMPDGTVKIEGDVMWAPSMGQEIGKLRDYFDRLRFEVNRQETPGNTSVMKYAVLIRADSAVNWEHVQRVIMIVSMTGGVYRVELGTLKSEVK